MLQDRTSANGETHAEIASALSRATPSTRRKRSKTGNNINNLYFDTPDSVGPVRPSSRDLKVTTTMASTRVARTLKDILPSLTQEADR